MKVYECRILIEVDGETVGDMLDELKRFADSIAYSARVRPVAVQWDRPKGEEPKTLDIRDPGWKSYLGNRR